MTALLGRLPARSSHREWAVLIFKGIAALAAIVLLAATYINLEWTSRSIGSVNQLVGAQRIVETHQSFYEGATGQEGPLSLAGFTFSYLVGGLQGAWFVVAALVMCAAALVCVSAWITANQADESPTDRLMGAAAAVALFIFLTLGKEDFQHVLSGRSIVALFFALALALIVLSLNLQARSRKLFALGLAGVLVGLAVQTSLASAPTALVFGAFVLWLKFSGRYTDSPKPLPAPGIFATTAIAALVLSMTWFALRSGFSDVWAYWWGYDHRFMQATHTSIFGVLSSGVHDLGGYYRDHPLVVAIIVLTGFDAAARIRQQLDASLNLLLLGWWFTACLAVALSQRFFDFYLILPAVPIGFMAVVLAARYGRSIPTQTRPVAIVAIVLGTLALAGGTRLSPALSQLRDFRSPSATLRAHRAAFTDPEQTLRQVVAANSSPGSYVYAWSLTSAPYLTVNRRAASRYSNSEALSGETSLGASGPKSAIPDAWQKWGADLRRTPPALWIEYAEYPTPPDLPLAQVRDCAFKQVYGDSLQSVYKRVRPLGPCLDRAHLRQLDESNARARRS